MKLIPCSLIAALLPLAATTQPTRITAAGVTRDAMGRNYTAPLPRDDTGRDQFANGPDIPDTGRRVLATRKLHHPQVTEQPFTRSLRQVMLPDGTRQVFLRAHYSNGDHSAPPVRIDLPFRSSRISHESDGPAPLKLRNMHVTIKIQLVFASCHSRAGTANSNQRDGIAVWPKATRTKRRSDEQISIRRRILAGGPASWAITSVKCPATSRRKAATAWTAGCSMPSCRT